jgi:hypothetical protein
VERNAPRQKLRACRLRLGLGVFDIGVDRFLEPRVYLIERAALHREIEIEAQSSPPIRTAVSNAKELGRHSAGPLGARGSPPISFALRPRLH